MILRPMHTKCSQWDIRTVSTVGIFKHLLQEHCHLAHVHIHKNGPSGVCTSLLYY